MTEEALRIAEELVDRPEADEETWSQYGHLLRNAVPVEFRDYDRSIAVQERAVSLAGDQLPAALSNLVEAAGGRRRHRPRPDRYRSSAGDAPVC